MVRRIALLLSLALALVLSPAGWGEEPMLGTVVSVNPAEATAVLRVESGTEAGAGRELTVRMGETGAAEWLRPGQLVRFWVAETGPAETGLAEPGMAGTQPVARSIMAAGGTGRDPTGVRSRIGRDAAGRPPGGGRHGR